MKTVTWVYFLIAVAVVALLARVVTSSGSRTPAEILEHVQRLTTGPERDFKTALDELDFALRMAQAEGDSEMTGRVLAERGRILRTTGAYVRARSDLETVLRDYLPEDLDTEVELMQLEYETGDHLSAVARGGKVLARSPGRAEAWSVLGRVHLARAEARLAQSLEVAAAVLTEEGQAQASALLREASALDPEDPRRVPVLARFRALFDTVDEERVREALSGVEEAGRQLGQARHALAESFGERPNRTTLYDYLELLRSSERHEDAVDFGLAAVHHPPIRNYQSFVQDLMDSLERTGRPHLAVDVVGRYFSPGVVPGRDFYETWCRNLYLDEQWKQLLFVANRLRNAGDEKRRSMANFYMGHAQAKQGLHEQAVVQLRRYATGDPVEPLDGALQLAWADLATCYRELGMRLEEKSALRAALYYEPPVGLEPPSALTREPAAVTGERWLRLNELVEATEPASFSEALDALARAISLLPARADELLPRWLETGERSLAASQTELRRIYRELDQQKRLVPVGEVGAYELFGLAQLHLEAGRHNAAHILAGRVLEIYPDFLPAIDLVLAASVDGEAAKQPAVQALIRHLSLVGPDPFAQARLHALPADAFTAAQRVELMRLDPERTGRLAFARDLRDAGRTQEALLALKLVPAEQLGDTGHVIMAELLRDLRRSGAAAAELEAVAPGSPIYPRALAMAVGIAARAHDLRRLDDLVAALVAVEEVEPAAVGEAVDELLAAGFPEQALRLVERLDGKRKWRSGGLLLQGAQAHWLAGERQAALEDLARAQAFLADGAAEIGFLVAAVEERGWNRLPWLVQDLMETPFQATRLQAAVLDLLGERLEDANTRIGEGQRRERDEPLWSLLEAAVATLGAGPLPGRRESPVAGPHRAPTLAILAGQGDGDRDPRQLLVVLLALEHPQWTAWALSELERLTEPPEAGLWPRYLRARGLERMGRVDDARETARALVADWPRFVPGWDLLEGTTRKRLTSDDDPELYALRRERRVALGGSAGEDAEGLVLEAIAATEAKDFEGALALLRRALDTEPDHPLALARTARLLARNEEYAPALRMYSRALLAGPPRSDGPLSAELLEVTEAALAQSPEEVPLRLLSGLFESCATHRPRDPLLALALARFVDAADPEVGPEVGMSRALERLVAFREATGNAPLHRLQEGSESAWFEFLLERDDQRAEAFVHAELERRPGSVDLWRMLGRAYAHQGRRRDAVELYESMLQMLPDARTSLAIASLLAQEGKELDRVERYVRTSNRLDAGKETRLESQLTLARAKMRGDAKSLNEAVTLLAELWDKPRTARRETRLAQVGEAYGIALCWRANRADRQLAHEVLSEVEPMITDPARRNLIHALSNLALHLPGRASN